MVTGEPEIDELFADVEATAGSSFDSKDLEPKLEAVVRFARHHPERRPELVAAFLSLLDVSETSLPLGRPGAVDVLEFCMHELRWPEVRDSVATLLQSEDPRVIRHAQRVLDAFHDDWPLGEIYAAYRP